jgi:phage terminase Nu1 subunit (DNA packaging protein)
LDQQPKYINEKKVAEITEIGVQTLRNDRHLRRGLPYVKKGRTVRYSLADVIAYMESHKIKPEN